MKNDFRVLSFEYRVSVQEIENILYNTNYNMFLEFLIGYIISLSMSNKK